MGFPSLKKITEALKDSDSVVFFAVQTVFEGYSSNTRDKLRSNQVKYGLKIPMTHAPGDPSAHTIPQIMKDYRSGGTPWTVIIDPGGKVVYNAFHIKVGQAVSLIDRLMADQK